MAQQSDRAIPPEETFNLLREKAAKDGDGFTLKVWRRPFQGGVPELAATLSGASVEHFGSPELWLPQLCGGGNFSLQGYHPVDLGKPGDAGVNDLPMHVRNQVVDMFLRQTVYVGERLHPALG